MQRELDQRRLLAHACSNLFESLELDQHNWRRLKDLKNLVLTFLSLALRAVRCFLHFFDVHELVEAALEGHYLLLDVIVELVDAGMPHDFGADRAEVILDEGAIPLDG